MKQKSILIIPVLAWSLTVGVGLSILHAHSARPGDPGSHTDRWPRDSAIPRVPDRPMLLVFLDSHCPCSEATIAELKIVLARCRDRAATRVLITGAEERGKNWVNEGPWASLVKFSGVELRADNGGVEASRFGVATSGQVLLFDPGGKLMFQGGVTGARGHAGENYGRDAVIGLILGDDIALSRFPVFGCPIKASTKAEERAR